MDSPTLPTAGTDWVRMARTARRVLARPRWLAVAVLAALATVSAFALPGNLTFVRTVVVGGSLPLGDRFAVLAGLYPLLDGDALLRGAVVWLVGATVGTNLALLGYHLVEHEVGLRESRHGVAGLALAAVGAGCPTCGVGIVAGVLSTAGVAGGFAVLPLHGFELVLLALPAGILSIHWTVEGMRGGDRRGCPVDPSR
jgi:hypothetical protein